MYFSRSHNGSWSWLMVIAVILSTTCQVHARADILKFFRNRQTDSGATQVRYDPYRDDRHGCGSHAKVLSDSYQEAAQMIDAAVQAIEDLKDKPKINPVFKKKSKWNWNRKATTIEAFFGIKINADGGAAVGSTYGLGYVEKIFKKMQTGMNDDISLNKDGNNRYPALYCGDGAWQFVAADGQIPYTPALLSSLEIEDPKTKLMTPRYPFGAWYYNFGFVARRDGTQSTSSTGMCRPLTLASTTISGDNHIVTWCDLAFQTLVAGLDKDNVKEGIALGDKSIGSLSETWVHELAHYHSVGETRVIDDTQAVDENNNEIPDQGTYTLPLLMNLVKFKPNDAPFTADAYALFAKAMYLDKYRWAEDKSTKYPN